MNEWMRNTGEVPEHVAKGGAFEARYRDGTVMRQFGNESDRDPFLWGFTDPRDPVASMIDIYEWRPVE